MSVEKLRSVIKAQLQDEVSQNCNFDIGYLQGSNVVCIRNKEDLVEIWGNVRKGLNTTLWCDGLKKLSNKRARSQDDSSDDEVEVSRNVKRRRKDKEKEDQVESLIEELKKQHGESAFNPFQYRMWAEMIVGGVHTSMEDAPNTTMFVRAGGGVKKTTGQKTAGHVGSSPAKAIDSRSKCYRQLADLKNLVESGILSEEYSGEKATIMGMLKKLV